MRGRCAIELAQKIFAEARRGPIEPALLVSTHLNLGATYFWQGRLEQALPEYAQALAISQDADLRLHAFRARYNLAEAHYRRFRDLGNPDDERLGDAYVAAALAAPASDSSPAAIESARGLKAEVLGERGAQETDRLLPEESAVHFDAMSEIRRQRAVLAVPGAPEAHARAHLAIARAYLGISNHERESARDIVERHGLQAHFAENFDRLRATFERELTREQRLAAAWQEPTEGLLNGQRRTALVAHLVSQGAINKSGYAALCQVSPATASKHLATLAKAGLLVRTGKGPSTRYELPPVAPSDSLAET